MLIEYSLCIGTLLGTEVIKIKSDSAFKEFTIHSERKDNKCSKLSMIKCCEYFKETNGLAPSPKEGGTELHLEGQ